MAFLLRSVNKPKWVLPQWAAAGDIPGDVLLDLRTSDNTLSVWMVASDDEEDVKMALTALASNRTRLDKLDYTLIDESILAPIQIVPVQTAGRTPHIAANSYHRDLIELTVAKIGQLAQEMMPLARVRISETRVKSLLMDALGSEQLDRSLLAPTLLRDLVGS